MAVYDKACERVAPEDRKDMYFIYIDRATERFGVTKTREIYEKAIQNLPDKHLKPMILRYAGRCCFLSMPSALHPLLSRFFFRPAPTRTDPFPSCFLRCDVIGVCHSHTEMERKLGEIDRARHLYSYGSQFTDPRADSDYWKTWHDFEVHHGNEDTFREMLRLRRSVQALSAQAAVVAVAAMPDAINAPAVKPSPMPQLEMAAHKAEKEQELKTKQFKAVCLVPVPASRSTPPFAPLPLPYACCFLLWFGAG
jgi:pre-mRNA-splicing factor SYF1